jgi:REP element-mobilizing transposase RayT
MRKPRIQFEGALFHVIVRGNQRRRVFLDPPDYRRYLQIMGKKAMAHSIKTYAYCLMPNHGHLLLEQTGYSKLSRYMQGLQTAYTKHFNKRHKKIGHVFQGRYKALLVERDSYLLELVRYIHLNPTRAKLEEKIGEYPWTSHAQYMGKEKRPLVGVAKKEILAMFGKGKTVGAYLKFIREGVGEGHRAELYETGTWQVLGSEGYEARSLARLGEKPERPVKLKMGIEEIWSRIKGRERLKEEPKGHYRSRLVEEAGWLGYECAGVSQTESGKYLGMGQSGINNAIKRLEKRWEKKPGERKILLSWARGFKKSDS